MHAPPGPRDYPHRPWTFHDLQCQTLNPNPTPANQVDGYPVCCLRDGHLEYEPHCYRRHVLEK